MSTLSQYLDDYKNITIDLINNIYCDNLEDIDEAMQKRQNILDSIQQLKYCNEEFNLIADEIKLFAIEKRLKDVMTEKKEKLRIQMERISLSRNANNSYNKNLYGNSGVFSKKI